MTAIPTWDKFMVPVLQVLSDGVPMDRREIFTQVIEFTGLTPEQLSEVLSSGRLRHENRISWAISKLTSIGALTRPMRATYAITDVGHELLAQHATGIPDSYIRAAISTHRGPSESSLEGSELVPEEGGPEVEQPALDPVEQVEVGINAIHASVADELLSRLLQQPPAFFEQAVLDLLIAMGYGGTAGKATRTQLSNDGGIDGIIDQDALGLSRVYIQAKRYAADSTVGRPDLQAFVGALAGQQASQGVFITTSRFSGGAHEYAANVPHQVVLVDGQRLTNLMIHYRVGVQIKQTVHIVEIDEDFFE